MVGSGQRRALPVESGQRVPGGSPPPAADRSSTVVAVGARGIAAAPADLLIPFSLQPPNRVFFPPLRLCVRLQ